ncbi:iron-containing alcohol dehydrogenase [Terrarubrum flagellatum]|uniref:iron-containing alcohol dehydrogenase n=1 Tax=Terrirubrum flagellatum TaxID=2895980 RepID=UPI00314544C8
MSRIIETAFNTSTQKRFYLPSKFVWGVGCHQQLYELIEDCASIAVFVDAAFENHPFMNELRSQLGARLAFVEVCRSMPQAQRLREIARTLLQPEAIVSIGGGSTVDAAKAVVAEWLFGTFDGVGMGDKRGMPWRPDAKRPLLIGLPTTAGTGADVSRYYVAYDAFTKGKTHGKSWDLVVDWVLVDPIFLRSAPPTLMLISAFDAFVHLFETFICRGERSWFGDMLSLDGIARLMSALDAYVRRDDRSDETLLALNYSAAVGGIAISNIRTGNIHEAAGALLEVTSLSHGETLMVFLRPAYNQYRGAIADREALLIRHLSAHAPELGFRNFDGIVDWWRSAFDQFGLLERIDAAVNAITDWNHASRHIRNRVVADRVWCEKESPLPLMDTMVDEFIKAALPQYTLI